MCILNLYLVGDSLVSAVIYGLDDQGSIPGNGRDLCFCFISQTYCGIYPTTDAMGMGCGMGGGAWDWVNWLQHCEVKHMWICTSTPTFLWPIFA